MEPFKRHEEIDYGRFAPASNNPEALYGLPQQVTFCRQCIVSNQRPNSTVEFHHSRSSKKETIHFDDDGVCDACRTAEAKDRIDWEERERELHALCDQYRRTDGRPDCLVPGSGGKDSFYAAHILRHKYNMHPLTTTWAPHIYTDWGWRNFQAWIHAGFDNILFTPNGRVHRLLTRLATEVLLHPFQPFILGQKNLSPKIALQHGIQLIFYGENEAEFGNPAKDNESAIRDWEFFSGTERGDFLIGGVALHDLKESFGLEEVEFQPYLPENPNKLKENGIEVRYLGYYERWHPQGAYYYAVEHGGFQASPERTPGTYSKYHSIDDKIDDLHFYTTFIKFGIGHATHDAAQEVRNADIVREEAVALARKFDGEFPERFIDELFEYLSLPEKEFPVAARMFEHPIMDREYFSHVCDRFRSPHLWERNEGKWSLRNTCWRP